MWFYRRLLRVKWTDKRTNESILNQLGVTGKLIHIINQRKLRYIGHATRNQKTDLLKVAYQGKIDSKRIRGRPTTTLLYNIKEASGLDIYRIAWEIPGESLSCQLMTGTAIGETGEELFRASIYPLYL